MNPDSGFDDNHWVRVLKDYAPALAMETHLADALDRSVRTPGKMMRARMVYAAAQAHGLPSLTGEYLACAVEYFHIASLLFDDLPCMDDATTRRGRPCVHRIHGEATAILAALTLINRAHVLAGFAFAALAPELRLKAVVCIDESLGVRGLAGGQARDLRFRESSRDAGEIGRIAMAKTGALLKLAILLPALPAYPDAREFHFLKALALYWGLWLQAGDDLKDVLSTENEAGKPTRRDAVLERPNLALAIGVTATRLRVNVLEEKITRTLRKLEQCSTRWAYLNLFQVAFAEKSHQEAA